jgi:hypothetical protein
MAIPLPRLGGSGVRLTTNMKERLLISRPGIDRLALSPGPP